MTWLRNNWFKIGIIAILLIGLFFYVNHLQNLEINKEDIRRGEFIASRKRDCLEIYKTESQKLNNVQDWNYNQSGDKCEITYKDSDALSNFECNKNHEISIEGISDPQWRAKAFHEWVTCTEGIYIKEF